MTTAPCAETIRLTMLPAPFGTDAQPFRQELVGTGQLEELARRLAHTLRAAEGGSRKKLLSRMRGNERLLGRAYRDISQSVADGEPLTTDAEWLLDNFYVIEEVLREVRTDLPSGYYGELPSIGPGPCGGLPRVYSIALALLSHTDSSLEEGVLLRFVQAYQGVRPLTIGEAWAVPIMLRVALLENLARLSLSMLHVRQARAAAAAWAVSGRGPLPEEPPPGYLAGLLGALAEHPTAAGERGEVVRDWLTRHGLDQAEILRGEHQRQAANQVSIGNCITSLRLLAAIDWAVFFEKVSLVEHALRSEPPGVYARQDFATRDAYRRAIERLARGSSGDELDVARRVLDKAAAHPGDPRRGHLGYYLVGDGQDEFAAELRYRPRLGDGFRQALLRRPNLVYFAGLAVTLGLLLAGVVWLAGPESWPLALAVALAAGLPLSQVAVAVVNDLVCRLLPPRVLPKLDFSKGVAADCPTFVVIPTLLTRAGSAAGLLDRLEMHYLANPDPQLRFALLTDFADAPSETTPEDEAILQAALDRVRALNARHFPDQPPRFFLFHRKRVYNPSEGCWMGHERKRGKLEEFNRLLRGDKETTYVVQSSDIDEAPRARFVLTLDSDTLLPRDAAQALIGTLAHPLNQPVLSGDGRRVVSGFGVLQPRVSFLYATGSRSRFARLFAYSAGIDPYSIAVSDPYMDLFGRGSFTGKGLYDIDTFDATAGRAFPDNHILSHDLIESTFARCGLVTDVEVFDDFPSRYTAYARREHRWVRGDWQLLPWLAPRVPTKSGERIANPLPLLERWKIVDNLRRSLVPPGLLLLLVLGWTVLPGSPALWSLVALAILGFPVLMGVTTTLTRLVGAHARTELANVRTTMPSTLGQSLLSAAFLTHQASDLTDAILRTLTRVFLTRRHMLEWETAAATDQRLGGGLLDFVSQMRSGLALDVLLGALVGWAEPAAWPAAAPWLAAWLLSPLVAWWLSRPTPPREPALTDDERRALRHHARMIWGFFETFVGPDDHWLPPDNYQEGPKEALASRTSPTNMGLLLTSTLAAHDFGHLTLPVLEERLSSTLETFRKMERYHGHFYNWYDTRTLTPLQPAYVSSVDSGNLLACLLTLKQGLRQKLREPVPSPSARDGLLDTLGALVTCLHAHPPKDRDAKACRELLDEARLVEQELTAMPTTLSGWDELLAHVEGKAANWPNRLDQAAGQDTACSTWARRFTSLVRQRRQEVAALCPWLALLRDHPDDRLDRPAPLRELAGRVESLADGDHAPEVVAAVRRSLAPALSRGLEALAEQADAFAEDMDFGFLYNPTRHLFAIGYHVPLERLDQAHYDLLASEACLTSFLAVARGEVPRKHWFQLGRPFVRVHGMPGLVSWGGTMFEYLMPRLFLASPPGTLLDTAQHAAVVRQIEYGRQTGVPWGVSESAYNLVDAAGNYQYQAFGVPGLGLKRGLNRDLVVAPYATFLALQVAPRAALANLERLAGEGAVGALGYHEAIDYTADRLPQGQTRQVIPSYMAHHQGMSLLAIANLLLGDVMPARLAREPMVRAVSLLLQERVPLDAPEAHTHEGEEAGPVSAETGEAVSRRLTTPNTPLPRTHLLSNGKYTVLLTNSGAGYSRCGGLDVTRWEEDATRDHRGQFCYVRDLTEKLLWSAGHQPVGRAADAYEVLFSIDKAEFRRRDGDVETHVEVAVAPDRDVEVRRVKLVNHGTKPRQLELTSFVEVVLAPHGADVAHPAFQKLFLQTEYVEAHHALICRRRPRSEQERPVYAVHVLTTDGRHEGAVEYETDRNRFLGRRRTPANPAALDFHAGPMSGTTGAVLDPVLALRATLTVPPGSHVVVSFSTAVVQTREEAVAVADLLDTPLAVQRVFELAWAHSRVELRHRSLSIREAHFYQRLAGHVLFPSPAQRASAEVLQANTQGQSGLWRHGISGDLPIVLARVGEGPPGVELVRQLLAAHGFWASRGFAVDLVLLNEAPTSYHDDLQARAMEMIRASESRDRLDKPGGVFVRKVDQFSPDDLVLLQAVARVALAGDRGPLADQVNVVDRRPRLPARRRAKATPSGGPDSIYDKSPRDSLLFYNGVGGFSPDGSEYVLPPPSASGNGTARAKAATPPAPWANVVANETFGFLVSDSGSGYTWSVNAQLNRLTPWRNDPVSDEPGEAVYLADEDTGEVWTPTPLPRAGGPTAVRHGIGYTVFEQRRARLDQELTFFVPPDEPVKLIRLRLRNRRTRAVRLAVTFYAEWVLGRHRDDGARFIVTRQDEETGALLATNAFNSDFAPAVAFTDVNRRPRTLTGDRAEFLGRNGSLADPEALHRVELSGHVGAALDPCAALQTPIELQAGEEAEVTFLLGQAPDVAAARRIVHRYRDPAAVEAALAAVRQRWDEILGAVRVRTPDPAFDLLVNHWLVYQALSCRVWGRTGFYQSGGAYGFRDQLQDVMALVHALPGEARKQLLRAARHQFVEGDVQHWWHPPVGRGVRTRFSDDFLWLPFVACYYVQATGDWSVLDEKAPFLVAPPLNPDEHEVYGPARVSEETATLYEHCRRSLDHGWKLGPHGLPLMGTGDWNDGMNLVGAGGKGESVWVAWFQIACLRAFAEVSQRRDPDRTRLCRERAEQLRQAVEAQAWDGEWYRRAYFDDGTPLGSKQNDECRIDSIAQSWAVLSGVAEPGRAEAAVNAAVEQLVRKDDRLALLFAPPFDQGSLNPGYIKGYPPGIRENGGQYTHAATWLVIALARLGRGDEAYALFDLLNPVRHATTPADVARYRVEPYVVAADVYSEPPHVGRGGWTWYTGSASWLYQAALGAILGLSRAGDKLILSPCLPARWETVEIDYRHGRSLYRIVIENKDSASTGRAEIALQDDGETHEVRVQLGKSPVEHHAS
ncbi:MAG: glucoamylase family protein [Gemmataceae bacterium]